MSKPQQSLGILAQKGKHPARPFGEQTGYFQNLIRLGGALSLNVIVFTANSINWSKKTVVGYTWQDKPRMHRGWKGRNCPLPMVIYDRTFYFRGSSHGGYIGRALARLKNIPGVRFINPIELMNLTVNKYLTVKTLQEKADLRPYLPACMPLRSLVSDSRFWSRFPKVFIKPNFGSAGEGIHTLERHNGVYLLRGYNGGRPVYWAARDLEAIDRRLSKRVRPSGCIIQAGIDLARYQDRTFDIRVLVQKNGVGAWTVTGYAARLAGKGGYLTNLHRGGVAQPLDKILGRTFGQDKGNKILAQIKGLCLKIVEAVENKIGPFGEVAIDLGVDKTGKLWVIELNSRPGRTIFQKIGAYRLKRASIANILEYGRYLLNLPLSQAACVGQGIEDAVDSHLAGEDVAGILGVDLDDPGPAAFVNPDIDPQLT